MQNLPIDTDRLSVPVVVMAPELKTDPETGEVKNDRDGNPVWRVGVAVAMLGRRKADVIDVSTPVKPEGVAIGTPVRLVNLVARTWDMNGRFGVSFSADGVTPAVSPAASLNTAPNTGKSKAPTPSA